MITTVGMAFFSGSIGTEFFYFSDTFIITQRFSAATCANRFLYLVGGWDMCRTVVNRPSFRHMTYQSKKGLNIASLHFSSVTSHLISCRQIFHPLIIQLYMPQPSTQQSAENRPTYTFGEPTRPQLASCIPTHNLRIPVSDLATSDSRVWKNPGMQPLTLIFPTCNLDSWHTSHASHKCALGAGLSQRWATQPCRFTWPAARSSKLDDHNIYDRPPRPLSPLLFSGGVT